MFLKIPYAFTENGIEIYLVCSCKFQIKIVILHERVITLFVKQLNENEQDERNLLR